MAFIHPRCGTPAEVVDTAHFITLDRTITARGFTCPVCSERAGRPFHFTTEEVVGQDDAPTPRVRAKWGFDSRSAEPEVVADEPPRREALRKPLPVKEQGDQQEGGEN